MSKDRPLDQFYLEKQEPNKSCLLALRKIILDQDASMTETIKYGMPCFCYKKKMLCYLWIDKKTTEPYLLMVDGKLLKQPQLMQGTRSRMKILPVNPNLDLPLTLIVDILQSAIKLHR